MNTPTGTRRNYATLNSYGTGATGFRTLAVAGILYYGTSTSATASSNKSYLYFRASGAAGTQGAVILGGSTLTAFLNGWLVFDTYMNYSTGTVSFSVNGISVDSTIDTIVGYSRTFDPSYLWEEADIQTERDRPASGTSSGGAVVRYDNYLMETTPTPGTAALMGLGGLVMARRRRA